MAWKLWIPGMAADGLGDRVGCLMRSEEPVVVVREAGCVFCGSPGRTACGPCEALG